MLCEKLPSVEMKLLTQTHWYKIYKYFRSTGCFSYRFSTKEDIEV